MTNEAAELPMPLGNRGIEVAWYSRTDGGSGYSRRQDDFRRRSP